MEKQDNTHNLKTFKFQSVASKNALVLIYNYKSFLFNIIDIDGDISSSIKTFTTYDLYEGKGLRYIYDHYSLYMNFYFRNCLLPKRCFIAHKELTDRLYSRLKQSKSRVSKSKVKETVKHLVKHVSRLKFHKLYTLTYSRKHTVWDNKEKFNASYVYMMELISMLEEDLVVSSITGIPVDFTNSKNISSLLIFTPEFITWCNGGEKYDNLVKMDDCLLEPSVDSVEIRVKTENCKKKKEYTVVNPEPKDKIFYAQAKYFVDKYNEAISNRVVEIEGRRVPELFFRRIFANDLQHGARFYDRGEIQGKNATTRSTIIIDGCDTVEKDYSALHYSLCAEKLGLDLKGKDPYDFEFNDVVIDEDEIIKWKEDYNIQHKYDPLRNVKKTAVLIMFNAKSKESARSALVKKLKDDFRCEDKSMRRFVGIKNISANALIEAILEHNKEVEQFFNTGIGLHLQWLDSQMIEYCISKFMEINEICLPVHDSLIVKESLGGFAEQVMEEAYFRVMGSKVNCKVG